MRTRHSLSQIFSSANALLPMLLALALMFLPGVAYSQQIQSVSSNSQQIADTVEKASCPPVRNIRLPMRGGKLSVAHVSGAIVFEAGMAIDADGAPNAYGPHDRGLDRLANARRHHRWIGIATDKRGKPLVQQKGRYRGYYVSTTSLRSAAIRNPANPAIQSEPFR